MAAKSLEEVYAGVLSRDWAKLLDAIEAGERRVVCYTTDDRNAKGPAALKTLREHCVVLRGGKFGCKIAYDGTIDTGWIPPGRQSMMEFLEKNGIGFFDPSPKPTNDVEVFALRQHILKSENRLRQEARASISFDQRGPKAYMGTLRVSHHGTLVFRIDSQEDGRWLFSSPIAAEFGQCCQWMMFSLEKLGFDYLEFECGWKP